MKDSIIRPILALLAFATTAWSAPVTWTTSTVSGPSDVSTAGTLVGAMNVGRNAAETINGVTFAADPTGAGPLTLGSATVSFGNFATSTTSATFWTLPNPGGSAAYANALDYGRTGTNTADGTVTLGGLTVGRTYLVQLWIADTRPSSNARVRNVDGVPTTSGGPNIATGVFVADAATQVFTISHSPGAFGPLLNLLQVRDVPFLIFNTADSGPGSLRQAIADAIAAPGADTVTFAPALSGQTITLLSEIAISDADGVTVDASTLPGGLTLSGGGLVRHFNVNATGNLTLRALTLTGGNTAGTGGSVYNDGTLTAERCTFTGNTAGTGGAIFADNGSTSAIRQCTLTANTATSGNSGAMQNRGLMTVSHCTIFGNIASSAPGGFFHNGSGGNATLEFSIIAGNTSGDLRKSSNMVLTGTSIVQANPTGAGGFTGTGSILQAAPLLAALGNYGGPTQTMPPVTGSPALNAALGSTITTDQRGIAIAGPADIGASEGSVPWIAPIPTQTIAEDGFLRLILVVADPEDGLGSLTITGHSSNAALVAQSAIVSDSRDLIGIEGQWFRFAFLTPIENQYGETTITITVTDPQGNSSSTSFLLIVSPVYDPPSIDVVSSLRLLSPAGPQTVNLSGISTDQLVSASPITVTASSSNPTLIPHPSVSYTSPSGSGSLSFTPVAGQTGFALVTVTVNDGTATTSGTFYVSIPVNPASNVTHTGDSGSGSLRQAIADALALPGSQSITFDPILSGQTITLASEIVLGDDLIIDASNLPAGLTINGNSTSRIFYLTSGANVDLRGLTLTGGNSDDGGAIYNAGTLTLTNCILSGNSANNDGGGAIFSYGSLELTNCTLSGNSAVFGLGGAIYNFMGTLTLTDCTLSQNTAYEGGAIRNQGGGLTTTHCTFSENSATTDGGAIYNSQTFITLVQSSFSGNTATTGGAIYNSGTLTLTQCTLSDNSTTSSGGAISNSGTLTLTLCTLSGNSATSGGAIFNSGTLTLTQCTLSDNSATFNGGAIFNSSTTLTLTQCTLSGNSASDGGAIYGGDTTLSQCTLSGNSASGNGGAIYILSSSNTLTLTQCTLSGNSAIDGGAIYTFAGGTLTLTQCTLSGNSANNDGGALYNRGEVTLTNSLLAGNTAGTGPDIRLVYGGTINRSGMNLIGNNATIASGHPEGSPNINGDYVGTSASPLDPLLAPLGDYGGSTQTMRLLPNSPAINRVIGNEVQRIIAFGENGSFTVTFKGVSTPPILHSATANGLQTALNALSSIGGDGGSVTVAKNGYFFYVNFDGGSLAGTNQPSMTLTRVAPSSGLELTVLANGGLPFSTDQRGYPIVGMADIGAYESEAPTISTIAAQVALSGVSTGPIPFTIGDVETAATSLTVTRASSNTTLVPNANILLSGTSENRTLTLTPAANQTGTATITLTVNDGANTTSTSFQITVLENTPYNAWKLAEFGNNAGTPAIAGDTADADNDGLNTFLEYATRGAPLAFTVNPFTGPTPVAGPAYQFSFPYRAGIAGLRYSVQRSNNLAAAGGWTEIYSFNTSTNVRTGITATEDSINQIITLSDPTSGPANFWRLRVEEVPLPPIEPNAPAP